MRYRVSLYFDLSGVEPEDWVYSAFAALRDAGLLEYVRGELEDDYTIEAVPEPGDDPGPNHSTDDADGEGDDSG
ncbi:hypothetical protein [Limnochorda pilosa]|uniref:Uncharacterized protein n=1 Tax=Limnochorda pilosa TaxID=1555112 RepID=A0A0K2SIX3_LIMPI|nr:hypothetical protein [Limnochorda pilosa]BAS27040.1 hypothetical protein LIP_1183 [Limnochorda pilosa]